MQVLFFGVPTIPGIAASQRSDNPFGLRVVSFQFFCSSVIPSHWVEISLLNNGRTEQRETQNAHTERVDLS
jgi:hypothetical protein